ncbi:MAG: Spy/CpxP family protein refolding chaperone [Ferruginibacter sp.]
MKNISNNRWLTIISIVLLVANAVTLTLLWTREKRHREDAPHIQVPPTPGGQGFEFITKELQLTPQQQDAYKILREVHQAAQRVLQDSIRKSKDVFFEQLPDSNLTDAVLKTQSDKGLAFQQQLELLTFRHFQKLRAMCTAEQQKRFDAIIKEVLQQMGAPRMRPQGPPPVAGTDSGKMEMPKGNGNRPERRPPPPGQGFREDGLPPPPPPGEGRRRGDGPPPPRKENM